MYLCCFVFSFAVFFLKWTNTLNLYTDIYMYLSVWKSSENIFVFPNRNMQYQRQNTYVKQMLESNKITNRQLNFKSTYCKTTTESYISLHTSVLEKSTYCRIYDYIRIYVNMFWFVGLSRKWKPFGLYIDILYKCRKLYTLAWKSEDDDIWSVI